jgi:hypothetical protein
MLPLEAVRRDRPFAICPDVREGYCLDLSPEVQERLTVQNRFAVQVNADVGSVSNRPNKTRPAEPGRDKSLGVIPFQPILINERHVVARLTPAFQPRRLIIAPAADGCKRLLARVSPW